jgi:transcriptional regulator GlxA family with amidase domain
MLAFPMRREEVPSRSTKTVQALSGCISELLFDRLSEPWSVDRLAATVGLSSRTLHRILRRELGLSPMSLLKRLRLDQAKADLEAAGPRTTVTGVAYDCGFGHLGRFAVEYARRFGESPSQTLRRARARPSRPALPFGPAVAAA